MRNLATSKCKSLQIHGLTCTMINKNTPSIPSSFVCVTRERTRNTGIISCSVCLEEFQTPITCILSSKIKCRPFFLWNLSSTFCLPKISLNQWTCTVIGSMPVKQPISSQVYTIKRLSHTNNALFIITLCLKDTVTLSQILESLFWLILCSGVFEPVVCLSSTTGWLTLYTFTYDSISKFIKWTNTLYTMLFFFFNTSSFF